MAGSTAWCQLQVITLLEVTRALVYGEDMDGIGSQIRRQKIVVGGIESNLVRMRRFLSCIWSATLKGEYVQGTRAVIEGRGKSLNSCRSTGNDKLVLAGSRGIARVDLLASKGNELILLGTTIESAVDRTRHGADV